MPEPTLGHGSAPDRSVRSEREATGALVTVVRGGTGRRTDPAGRGDGTHRSGGRSIPAEASGTWQSALQLGWQPSIVVAMDRKKPRPDVGRGVVRVAGLG
jgi:hypothetical protein